MRDAFERVHWLNLREHADLLVHAICGDWLSPPDHGGAWFEPVRASRGEHVSLFCYEAEESAFAVCAVLPGGISADWVLRLRERLSSQSGEARWAHFAGLLGRCQSVAAGAPITWSTSEVTADGWTWRARRAVHPSALIERLLLRDRAEAEAQLRAVFGDRDVGLIVGGVGEIPLQALRANVGDKHSN